MTIGDGAVHGDGAIHGFGTPGDGDGAGTTLGTGTDGDGDGDGTTLGTGMLVSDGAMPDFMVMAGEVTMAIAGTGDIMEDIIIIATDSAGAEGAMRTMVLWALHSVGDRI